MSLFRLAANSNRHEAIAGKIIRSWTGLDKKIHNNIFRALSIFNRFHSISPPKLNQEEGTLNPQSSYRRLLSSAVEKDGDDNVKKKSIVRVLLNKYGAVAIGTYFCVWVMTLTSVFVCLDFDIFNAATFGLDPATAVLKVRFMNNQFKS